MGGRADRHWGIGGLPDPPDWKGTNHHNDNFYRTTTCTFEQLHKKTKVSAIFLHQEILVIKSY